MEQQHSISVGLVGVSGYTGMELARLLATHPGMHLGLATARAEAGKQLGAIYPFLHGLKGAECPLIEPDPERIAAACRLAFLAVPHTAATELAAALLERGVLVVDLSADFRLNSAETYETWYKVAHSRPDLLPQAVYGLPEINAQRISQSRLTANPGCYPTSVLLALAAAAHHTLIDPQDIIIDAKSGVSGAGRGANVATLYCEVADSFKAYNLGKHRHTPEIEQELGKLFGQPLTVSFNPHLLPLNRGMLSTIYTRLRKNVRVEEVHSLFSAYWQQHPWIRVMPLGLLPETRNVRGTMFCDIGLVVDERTQRLIIVSAIDNLTRGASGMAIASANLMLGLPMDTGLQLTPYMP